MSPASLCEHPPPHFRVRLFWGEMVSPVLRILLQVTPCFGAAWDAFRASFHGLPPVWEWIFQKGGTKFALSFSALGGLIVGRTAGDMVDPPPVHTRVVEGATPPPPAATVEAGAQNSFPRIYEFGRVCSAGFVQNPGAVFKHPPPASKEVRQVRFKFSGSVNFQRKGPRQILWEWGFVGGF